MNETFENIEKEIIQINSKQVDDVLIKGLDADSKILDVADVERYFSGIDPWSGSEAILQEVENTFAKELTPEEKTRAMTFIRGFQVGTTTTEIKAALVSVQHY